MKPLNAASVAFGPPLLNWDGANPVRRAFRFPVRILGGSFADVCSPKPIESA